MSNVIDTMFKITASVVGANALKDLADQINKSSNAGKNLQRSFNQGAMALKAFAASEAVQGLKRIASSAIDLGASFHDLNQQTNVSVATLGRLYGAAKESGVGMESVAGGLVKFNKSIIAAQDETTKQAGAFRALGVDIYDSNNQLKTAEKLFLEVSDRFKDTEDGAEKTAIALDLIKGSGAELIPLLNMGSKEIERLGLALGADFAKKADEFQDNMARINVQFTQLAVDITADVLPGLVALSDGFEKNNTAVKILVGTVQALESAFVGLSFAATGIVNGIGEFLGVAAVRAAGLFNSLKAISELDFGKLSGISKDTDFAVKAIRADAAGQTSRAAMEARGDLDTIIMGSKGNGTAASTAAGARGAAKEKLNYRPVGGSNASDEWLTKQREAIRTLQQEAELIGKTSLEVEKLKDARKLEAEIAEKTLKMSASQAAAFRAQAQEIINTRQAIIDYNYEQSRTFGAGAQEFFAKYSEAATDTAAQVKSALENAFKGASDALFNFVTTGKFSFKSFAKSIIDDLLKIQIQRSIMAPISNALGSMLGSFMPTPFANGGIMTSEGAVPLRKYARGGIADSPQMAMYGEGSQPEAFVPLPDGRRIPVALQGGSGGGGGVGDVIVNVNISNDGKSKENTKSSNTEAASFGRSIAAAVKSQIVQEQRPGGLLDKTR